jgi:hypothetical protein
VKVASACPWLCLPLTLHAHACKHSRIRTYARTHSLYDLTASVPLSPWQLTHAQQQALVQQKLHEHVGRRRREVPREQLLRGQRATSHKEQVTGSAAAWSRGAAQRGHPNLGRGDFAAQKPALHKDSLRASVAGEPTPALCLLLSRRRPLPKCGKAWGCDGSSSSGAGAG